MCISFINTDNSWQIAFFLILNNAENLESMVKWSNFAPIKIIY